MSILQQAKKKNRIFFLRPWFYIPFVALLGFFVWKNFSSSADDELHSAGQNEIYTVEKGDISIFIESDGNINHSNNIDLTFGISGKVKTVLVEEGEKVNAGDVLSTLETQDLEFRKQKAQIAVNIAKANLSQAVAGSSNEDIQIAQKNILSAQLDLQNTKEQNQLTIENSKITVEEAEKQLELVEKGEQTNDKNDVLDTISAETNLKTAEENLDIALKNQESNVLDIQNKEDQTYSDAKQTLSTTRIVVEKTREEAEKILDPFDDENYGTNFLFSAKDKSAKTLATDLYNQVSNEYIEIFSSNSFEFTMENKEQIDELFTNYIIFLEKNKLLMQKLITGIDASIAEPDFLRAFKTSLLNQETAISNEITKLTNAAQSIDTNEISKEKQILSDKNSITLAKQQLETAQQAISKTGTAQENTQVQTETSLLNAQKAVEKAKLSLDNAIKKAEINESVAQNAIEIAEERFKSTAKGPRSVDTAALYQQIENAEVNLSEAIYNLSEAQIIAPSSGTIIARNIDAGEAARTDGTNPSFVLLSESNFELNTFIEEADIARVFLDQPIKISFDALPDTVLPGTVNFISQTATIDANGIVTYEVTATVPNSQNALIREGMTAYSKFIIDESLDTVLIPLKAVNENMVEFSDGETKKITLGITDGKMVEVVSGLEGGEELIIKK